MSKIKKLILCIHIILIILFGTFLEQISLHLYRYNRMYVFVEQDELMKIFLQELQNNITFLWLIWGLMIIILFIETIFEFRKVNK
ncbi:MAG: hypothetical protein K0R21_1911 [Anaerocolumna sp.]|jgi:hypothetical protein|nr:hypothetical protein [Anaerocolumna sp.]